MSSNAPAPINDPPLGAKPGRRCWSASWAATTAAALLVCVAAGPVSAAPASAWYLITTDEGQAVGHASHAVVERADGRETIDEQVLLVQAPPGPPMRIVTRTTTWEDGAGDVRRMRVETDSRRGWSRVETDIADGLATTVRETRAGRTRSVTPLTAEVRLDGGEGLLRYWNPVAAPTLAFLALDAGDGVVERIVIEALPGGAPGRTPALRKRYENGELRGVSRMVIDGDGRVVSRTQPLSGSAITIALADRAAALGPKTAYRPLDSAMTKSPFRIGPSAARGHIRYRFGYRDGIAFELPRTGEQVASYADGGVVLDICGDCGPGLASDPAALADALKPTAWLQSDAPRLKAMAAPYLPMPPARRMEQLATRTSETLRKMDFNGHYSALETLERRSGDCTEAAVLLAALGRAVGIPTKVVNGLVYSRERYHGVSNVFMPHSWVLAYVDGEWRSYDAALETFDSTHVALTIGDGDPRSIAAAAQLAGLLEWREMAQVRARAAP